MTVVFSTYQSIQVLADAMAGGGIDPFDLVICDEAHRTTGVTLSGADESAFVRIHDETFIPATRRLYMTATPRIYTDTSKQKAAEGDAVLCSMDDPDLFGPEFHRLGFGEAVGNGLLTDYKVLVLAVDETAVAKTFQQQLADEYNELRLDDAAKIVGCWNGLAKRGETEHSFATDPAPMRRAVAFSRTIKDSRAIQRLFTQVVNQYIDAHDLDDPDREGPDVLRTQIEHVDGTFNALLRNQRLTWLKADPDEHTCRILTNARCLSEGVDVSDWFRDDELDALHVDDELDMREPAERRELGDTKRQIKAVLYSDQVETLERAILATGEQNRGKALIQICEAYLDATGQFNFQV